MMRITYFPAGGLNFASSRLRVWLIADVLKAMGHTVSFRSFNSSDVDVVVFQKQFNYGEIDMFKRAGKRIIFDLDDYITGQQIPSEVDRITVDTPAKLDLYPQAVVIPDALDLPAEHPLKVEHAEKLKKVVWVGNTENMYHLKCASRACLALDIDLKIITDLNNPNWSAMRQEISGNSIDYVDWHLDTVDEEMIDADLFIAPFVFDKNRWSPQWIKSKSANRILKAYGLGLPVAATPIPSYVEAGLFWQATTVEEWIWALSSASDHRLRQEDAERGIEVAHRFSADKVALQWIKVFES